MSLKREIDEREQYIRDKALLFEWRTRAVGREAAENIRLHIENELGRYIEREGIAK